MNDRAALRDRAAEALAAADGWTWTPDYDKSLSPVWQGYLKRADAVLAVLPPAGHTTDRAGTWMDAAAECDKGGGAYAERGADAAAGAAFALMETFLRKAGEAEYAATPCTVPNVCEDGGEPCEAHERILGHIEGCHDLCAPDCGQEWLRRLAAEAACPLCGHRTCMYGRPCGVIATERGDLPAPCGCTGVVAPQPGPAGVRQQPDSDTPCERCGHPEQAHNVSGCTACPGGWRADHRFMSVNHPPADLWSVEYHRMGAARLDPAVCTCGLGPDAIVHNEPPHPFNGRVKPGMTPVHGICTDCHHPTKAACHTADVPGAGAGQDGAQ